MQSPPFVQGATIRDVFDSTAIWDKPFFSHHVFKFVCIKLSKAPLLGNVDLERDEENVNRKPGRWGKQRQDSGFSTTHLLAARELELGPA